jgi:hypothetical protein
MTTLLQSAGAIAAALTTRLQACTVALGAETNLGVKVFRGRRIPSDDLIPCTVLIEGEDTPDIKNVGTKADIEQRYVVYAYVPCDPDQPNDAAHAAIRDIKRALFRLNGKPDVNLGGQVRRVRYVGRDIGPRADGERFVVAAVEFVVEFVEDLSAP